MSNYELLKTAIDAVIKANGRAEITGSIMNQTLIAMVNSLGKGYQFIGVATPEINPNTPDEKVYYLAMQAGTYTNFGNITLNTGLTVLKWDGEWHAATVFTTDTTPTHDSVNLITSGAVYNAIKNDGGAYDVSAHFPTGGEGGGNTYTLANAIAKVPVNMRKGGMSIKFIDAATNKYVKHTYLNPTTDGFTNVNNWQGIIESAAGFHTIGCAKNHQLASVGALVEEFGIKCVNELPTASASTMNKIYSIPTAHPVAGKRRDEYFTVETGIAPDYTDVKDLVTVTAIPDNALGAQVGEGKFIANDTTNNKAYYFVSVRALNEWGYEVTVEEVASGKIARMLNESQYASNGTAWVIDYHYADYTWESLSPDLSTLATKTEVAEVAHALELTAIDCENMTSIEYDELVQLRDNGELIPGKWYRIVDYHTTTAQEDTQSADHQFDVIVKADSINVLNENAFAAINEDDAYFTNEGAKLEAWELKYCLDNDTSRFAWADEDNGTGVIYWMRDEWGNECPYDFKNIMFKRYKITACEECPSLVGAYAYDGESGTLEVDTENPYWSYTFCMLDFNENEVVDVSIYQDKYINEDEVYKKTENNIVSPCRKDADGFPYILPNNVFITDTELCTIETGGTYGEFDGYHANRLSYGCTDNTFGNDIRGCSFGNVCVGNNIGMRCYYSIFGNEASRNIIGDGCTSNYFGVGCNNNIIKDRFYANTFLNNCYGNKIGDDCSHNLFEVMVYDNFLGAGCKYNVLKNGCHTSVLDGGCEGNLLQNGCSNIQMAQFNMYNVVGQYCLLINIPKTYSRNITIESGNRHLQLTSSQTTTKQNYLRNITVAKGVNNSDTLKTISHPTLNDTFQTIYKAQGSQEIEV